MSDWAMALCLVLGVPMGIGLTMACAAFAADPERFVEALVRLRRAGRKGTRR